MSQKCQEDATGEAGEEQMEASVAPRTRQSNGTTGEPPVADLLVTAGGLRQSKVRAQARLIALVWPRRSSIPGQMGQRVRMLSTVQCHNTALPLPAIAAMVTQIPDLGITDSSSSLEKSRNLRLVLEREKAQQKYESRKALLLILQ
ncbi:hypothetical protein GOODEAATRI_032290 [Goodea atripinnis]|uniref:Uncharacterized protein n=1 Tax=Goodea atripinnis TaxID=208336 RepID=A0ABV0N986_9TELE